MFNECIVNEAPFFTLQLLLLFSALTYDWGQVKLQYGNIEVFVQSDQIFHFCIIH